MNMFFEPKGAYMEWQQIYKDRSMDVETMLDRFVGDGTSVFVGTFEVAGGLIRPMLKRIQDGALHGISMYGGITSEDLHLDELTVGFDEFHYHNYFTGGNERNGISAGHTAYVPLHLHRTKNLVENDGIDVAFIAMTPPDKHGYCNIGHVGCRPEGIRTAKHVIAQINPSVPWVNGLERKNYLPGVSVAGFASGQQYLYDFIDHNPGMFFTPYSHVNNPDFIRLNDNMVSVNSAVSVDLTGQVCAESIGTRQYSGTGGQVDFIRGATLAKNGKAIIAMTSTTKTKNGVVSKIVPTLMAGSVVTSLRTDVQYFVTEYGCVNLMYCDIPERCRRLISIAHPDFRDELTHEAKKLGYLY